MAYEITPKYLAISKLKTHYRHEVQIVTISVAKTKNLASLSIQLYSQGAANSQYKRMEGRGRGGSQFLKYKFLKKKKKFTNYVYTP